MALMKRRPLLSLVMASTLVCSTTSVSLAHAGAAMISTETAASAQSAPSATRQHLQQLLSRADVRDALQAQGVTPAEALARANSLTDAQLAQIQTQLDELPAGASVVGAIVFIFLVLLITDILGFTDIFTFVKKTAR